MTPTQLTEDLDRRGLLADAQGSGCYTLRLDVPDDLRERWGAQFDAAPANLFDRFESAERAVYCGASGNVYDRLCDHVAAEKRRASVMRVCPPEAVVDVTPCAEPFDREYAYALGWSDDEIAVYVDGEVL